MKKLFADRTGIPMNQSLDARGCDVIREFFGFLLTTHNDLKERFNFRKVWNAWYVYKHGAMPTGFKRGKKRTQEWTDKIIESRKRNYEAKRKGETNAKSS